MSAKEFADDLSPVKRALVEIRELRARIADLERAAHEPMAIVGMSVRAPGGVVDCEGFATLLWGGVDAIGTIPPDRWDVDAWFDPSQDAPGKMTTRFGGFIDAIDRFDAEFFGVSPREAASMDPQQRLALELAWEALEDAGQDPSALTGSQCGVYLGIANGDYGRALLGQPEIIDPYFTQGNAYSVASGRISYLLGLQGPAVSIDTACSSSLVALHLACQGLRSGDCEMALVGGVNLIVTPEINVNFSKAGMMAPDGRCKTFDAAADGYVRGEGGAMVVLRPLSKAVARGDRVLAVVRGSAINQDGRSNGLTAPNGPAQEAVIRAALASAGVRADQIGYVETHGTGTPLGDPIEVNALGAVMQDRPRSAPLAIGSVKTNVGHLEAAAGLVGVVKTVLALGRHEIPPHRNLRTPNPFVDWASLPVTVPTRVTSWDPIDGRRIAGVSSFGFSGTNAHVVLEEAPSASPPVGMVRRHQLLTLSARNPEALAERVARMRDRLGRVDAAMRTGDLCFSANVGRAHFDYRLAIAGDDCAALDAALAMWQRGESSPSVTAGVVPATRPRVAFLFPGQGPQYLQMGRELYEGAPAYRDAFDRCCAILDPLLPRPLRDVLFGSDPDLLSRTQFAQPAMFAIEVSLAALWQSWGVSPVAVLGHSFGEYAAAHVAGVLSLEAAARMVALRGRLAQSLPDGGLMMVVEASEAEVVEALAGGTGKVSVAAVNGSAITVVSGEETAVRALAGRFAAGGARVKALRVSHAFHSPLMDPILDEFERGIGDLRVAAPRLSVVSTLTGAAADPDSFGRPGYWRRHLREPVRFADAIRALAGLGITHFVELSPQPVLLGMGMDCVADGQWLPSLGEGVSPWQRMFEGLRALYCAGVSVDWRGVERGQAHAWVPLPAYPFSRRRHWIDVRAGSSRLAVPALQRWDSLARAMDRQAGRAPVGLDLDRYDEKWEALADLTRGVAADCLRRSGLFQEPGVRATLDEVMAAGGFGAAYRHLMQRWLGSLAAAGDLRADGDGWVAERALTAGGLPALWDRAECLLAGNRPLLDYVRHCAALVLDVLQGRESPLETLFPGGSFDLARALYEDSSTMRYINGLAATACEQLGAFATTARPLRVLEIGAGTGGTSSAILPVLPPACSRYRFTDVSDAFLDTARTRFGGLPNVEFALFDMERDLADQGYQAGSYDLILSANAVHASKNLRSTLARIRELLAPGGVLLLVESTVHLAYFDMTTGLIEGWQHFADDLRTDNPLLPPSTWTDALRAAGFEEARAWPGEGGIGEALGQHVIVARVAGDADRAPASRGLQIVAPENLAATVGEAGPDWLQRYREAVGGERLEVLQELVRQGVMRALRLGPDDPPALHDRLMGLGMDSLMAVQLRNGLNRALKLERPLASTLMFDHPTIDAIARHLDERLTQSSGSAPAPATTEQTAAAETFVPVDLAAIAQMDDDALARLLDERLGT